MSEERWTQVDEYLVGLLVPSDPSLEEALATSAAEGLPPINVAPNQGKFLELLAKMQGSRRILEIGTLGGYSTIWLARALPEEGQLVSLELETKHAEVARKNLERAGVAHLVDVQVGPAIETLRDLIAAHTEPFDFIFIDADKEGYPDYLDLSLRLARPGTVIVADNVVRDGEVVNESSADERVVGVRRFLEHVGRDERLESTVVQTVGAKGYDGFALLLVK